MITGRYMKCKGCSYILRLRISHRDDNKHHFSFPCEKCGIKLEGDYCSKEKEYVFNLKNIENLNKPYGTYKETYSKLIDSQFPSTGIKDPLGNELSPFVIFGPKTDLSGLYFDNEIIEESRKSLFSKYEILNNYFMNNNIDLFRKHSEGYFGCNTRLEQIKALGLFNEIVMLPLINKRIYFPFFKYLKGLIESAFQKNKKETIDFIKRLHTDGLFNLFDKEIFENNLKLISRPDIFNTVRILNYQSSKEVIGGSITPQDLDLVLNMYNGLYETFGKLFIVIKGLNEIMIKNKVEPIRFENNDISITKFQQKDIYPRFTDLINNGFPKQYSYIIDNLLRNNISHKSYKVDEKKAIIKLYHIKKKTFLRAVPYKELLVKTYNLLSLSNSLNSFIMVLSCMISTDKKILIGYKRIELDDDKEDGGIVVIRDWYEMNYYRMIGFPETYHNLWELPNYENEEKPKVNLKVTDDKLIISLSEYGIKEEFNKDKNKSFIESFKENPPIKFRHELEEENYPFFKVYFKHASKNTK